MYLNIKILLLSLCIILFHFIGSAQDYNEREFPIIEGAYLGQNPPGLIPKVFAPTIVSTDIHGELNAIFSPDGKEFYFTLEVIPGRSYKTYSMQLYNGIWSKPKIYNILEKYQGGEPSISPDGKYMFFRSNLDESGNIQDNADIWWFERKTKKQTQPEKLGSDVNSKFNEAFPTMSSDSILYFHSNREGGEGVVDLYSSQFKNGKFNDPKNLGNNVNSKFPEFHPCISQDGSYLVFSSLNRPDGFGAIDLYITFRDKNGEWSKAINLGNKVNSNSMDYMPYISHDGKYLFFTSTRKKVADSEKSSQLSTPDIYWVDAKIIDRLKPF